jgi:hypothetical protein
MTRHSGSRRGGWRPPRGASSMQALLLTQSKAVKAPLDERSSRHTSAGTPTRVTGPGHATRAPRRRCLREHERRARDPRDATHLLHGTTGTTAIALTPVLTGGRWALGRGSHLPSVATDVTPGCADHTTPGWSRLPEGRLPLRQELHKLWPAVGSLLVRTKSTTSSKSRSVDSSASPPSGSRIRAACLPKDRRDASMSAPAPTAMRSW